MRNDWGRDWASSRPKLSARWNALEIALWTITAGLAAGFLWR